MDIKHTLIALGLLAGCSGADAAAPANYYQQAEGKGGQALLTALYSTITNHTTVSYNALLDLYKTSDVYPDGKIWDMYSTKHWNAGQTCGNYSVVGDCYNREHSFPKSWFDDKSPMYSDAFHLYPTDGKVNGQRSNFPYGECANGTYLPANGNVRPLGKLGASTFSGYSGKVFEPDDEYKGDFARSYFYMAACYNDRIATWNSPMLAGNKYPAFSGWAVNLLLKWHRQDPVSEKERNRQEVVYGRQHNRNPFIDHPELAEYIWGDHKNDTWSSSASQTPTLQLPVNGSTLDFGTSSKNIAITRTLTVKTLNAATPVILSVSGAAFTLSATSVSASDANSANGANVTVTFRPASAGSHSGSVAVKLGNTTHTVSLTGKAVDGLAAGAAEYVSDRSFVATWVYCGDDIAGAYRLDVTDAAGTSLAGYPKSVPATEGRYEVTDLDPETEYRYNLSSATMTSNTVSVTTGAPVPFIEFLYDGELSFVSAPGEPSATAEVLMECENIDDNVTLSVLSPFELSSDHSVWQRQLTVAPDMGRFYLRMNANAAGTYTGYLQAVLANGVTVESVTLTGTCSGTPAFHEDFEQSTEGFGGYNPVDNFHGTACEWTFKDTGIWPNEAHDGENAVRMGKTAASSITMARDITSGIGTVAFFARRYHNDAEATIDVQVSTDGGESFRSAGTVTVATATYAQYSVPVNVAGTARIRLQQTAGQRLNLDDVTITAYSSGLDDPRAERHQWDAFARDAQLVVTCADTSVTFGIYSIDGRTILHGNLPEGETVLAVAPGFYIVSDGTFSRRVIVE